MSQDQKQMHLDNDSEEGRGGDILFTWDGGNDGVDAVSGLGSESGSGVEDEVDEEIDFDDI